MARVSAAGFYFRSPTLNPTSQVIQRVGAVLFIVITFVCVCVLTHAMMCIWSLENNLQVLFSPSTLWV